MLSVAALTSLALNATRLPRLLPGNQFMPWTALIALALGVAAGGPEARAAAGMASGAVDGWQLAWAVICAVLSTSALGVWSLCWVQGAHGPIQDALGPVLTPALVIAFAVINAVGEELEFRMLYFGGLVAEEAFATTAGPSWTPQIWVPLAVALQAAYFAMLHVAAGFPSGASGGLLVFVWAVFLGILRLWAGGMLLALLLHFQADIVVFGLVFLQEGQQWRKVGAGRPFDMDAGREPGGAPVEGPDLNDAPKS